MGPFAGVGITPAITGQPPVMLILEDAPSVAPVHCLVMWHDSALLNHRCRSTVAVFRAGASIEQRTPSKFIWCRT